MRASCASTHILLTVTNGRFPSLQDPPSGAEIAARGTDVQDIIYSGCSATIHELKTDVDGREYLAVVIDDDPAAELHRVNSRYRYYYPDEVELLAEGTAV